MLTSAVLASRWSLSSLPSLVLRKLRRTLLSCMLHSRRISSMPRPSSFTSSSTFSRDTAVTRAQAEDYSPPRSGDCWFLTPCFQSSHTRGEGRTKRARLSQGQGEGVEAVGS